MTDFALFGQTRSIWELMEVDYQQTAANCDNLVGLFAVVKLQVWKEFAALVSGLQVFRLWLGKLLEEGQQATEQDSAASQ